MKKIDKEIEQMIVLELDKRRRDSADLFSLLKWRRKRVLNFRFIRASFRDWRED